MDFVGLMGAIMSDAIDGRISHGVCNAVANAGGKMLKAVDLQHRYGRVIEGRDGQERELVLVDDRPH